MKQNWALHAYLKSRNDLKLLVFSNQTIICAENQIENDKSYISLDNLHNTQLYYIIARARLKSWHQMGLHNPLSLSYDDHSISASLCTCNWIIFISFFSCVNLPFSSVQLELLLLFLCHYCPQQKLGPKTNKHKNNCCQKLNSTGMLTCHNF